MLTTRARASIVIAGGLACVLTAASSALAQDGRFEHNLECSGSTCEVGARSGGTTSGSPGSGADGGTAGSGSSSAGSPCLMPDVEFAQPGVQGPLEVPPSMAQCEAVASSTRAAQAVDPAVLAEQARAVMQLPQPDIGVIPAPDKMRFVNLAQWMWISEEDWEPVSATASVSTGSVTVVATPERVVWDTGDGHEVVCTGPGTVFSVAAHRAGLSDCEHAYTALPPGGAGMTFDLTANWEWGVSWSTSNGRGGELDPLTTMYTVAVPVSELHSVVTDVR